MDLIPKNVSLENFFNENINMKCDIYEKDDKYFIEVDLPRVKKENINISYSKGYLNIKTTQKDEVQEENKTYIRRERNYKKLERSFYVGDVEETKIKATYKDGILNVTIPKQKDNNTNKRISID